MRDFRARTPNCRGWGHDGRVTTTELPDTALRDRAEEVLRTLAGPGARLRDDQWTAIHALVVQRRRALVVQRTGWGKSAVYFVATALLRAAGAGPTVIVSPLLALMRNQIDAAARAGVHAVTVNSANTGDWEATYAAIDAGEVDVLLVSPERLNNPDFRDRVLPRLTASAGLLVVDEAHCVSDWGHDFRPDYRRLRALIAELPPGIPVLATTATANDRVVRDVTEQLGLASGEPLVLRGSLDRESLRLSVVRLPTPAQRLGWLAAHLAELPGAGIVYTLTIAAAEEVAEFLRERGLPRRVLHRQDRSGAAAGRGGGPAGEPGQGAGRHQRARDGVRQAGPRVRRAPGRAVVARRVLPADRPGRARGRAGGGGAAAGRGGPRHLGLLRLAGLPARAARAADAGGAVGAPAVDGGDRDPGRPVADAPGDAAEGPRQRRRREAGEGRLGRDRAAVGLRRGAAPADRHRPRGRAAGDARLPRHRASAGWCTCAGSSTTRTREPCGRCDTCTGTVWSPVGGCRGAGRGAGADQPPRGAGAAAQAVAVRAWPSWAFPHRVGSRRASSPTRAG